MAQLQPILQGKFLDEIDGRLIAEIIDRRSAEDVTTATIKRDLVALSSVLNYAIDQGWIENNPVLPRMRRLKEERDPIVLPEAANIRKLIAFAPPAFARLLEAAWRTGCRQNELVSAKARQFDRDRKRITVIGKRKKLRVVDLEPFNGYLAFETLTAVGDGALFADETGCAFRAAFQTHRRLCERLARQDKEFSPFRFHDLRHQHAVDWLRDGRSIYDLQQRLGHSSVKTTEDYLAHLTPEEKRRAMGVA